MAHCVHSSQQSGELDLLENKLTWIAHCPTSNSNLKSGVAPIAEMYDRCQIGLGSDVSGGHTFNMFEIMRHAIQSSKNINKPLTASQVFYMATLGGGSFFGNLGSFDPGYQFNALVLKERTQGNEMEQLEYLIYTSDHTCIIDRFIDGQKVLKPEL